MTIGFWDDLYRYEPLRQNRWLIRITSNNNNKSTGLLNDAHLYAKECTIPSYDINFTEHRLMTQTFKLPGLLKWKPVTLKFVSIVGGVSDNGYYGFMSTAGGTTLNSSIEEIIRIFGYKPYYDYKLNEIERDVEKGTRTQIENKKINSKVNYTAYGITEAGPFQQNITNNQDILGPLEINSLDDYGITVEAWKMYNWFISAVDYGTFTYNNEDFLETTLTIQYDFAIMSDAEFYNTQAEKRALLRAQFDLDQKLALETAKEQIAKEKREKEAQRIKDSQDQLLIEDFYRRTSEEEIEKLKESEEGRKFLADLDKKQQEIMERDEERLRNDEEMSSARDALEDTSNLTEQQISELEAASGLAALKEEEERRLQEEADEPIRKRDEEEFKKWEEQERRRTEEIEQAALREEETARRERREQIDEFNREENAAERREDAHRQEIMNRYKG